jgi:hypothetical protein
MRTVAAASTVSLLVFGLCAIAIPQSPPFSLGEYGNTLGGAELTHTKAPRVYDNDNLPSTDGVSVVGTVPDESSNFRNDAASDPGTKSDIKNKSETEIKPGQSLQERQEAYAHWNKRISKRIETVEQLARELDDLKRNAPMSVAILHLWPDDQMYLQLVVERQKALDVAEANLSDLQEQARKAGVPSSFRDGEVKDIGGESQQDRKTEHAAAMSQMQTRKAKIISSDIDDGTDAKENIAVSDSRRKDTPDPDKEKKDAGEIRPGQATEDRQKAYAVWKKRIKEREGKVDRLARELDNLKTNIPTAVILHLWPEDQIYLQMVADKQKALDEAKAGLSDSQELARKAGVPSSFAY